MIGKSNNGRSVADMQQQESNMSGALWLGSFAVPRQEVNLWPQRMPLAYDRSPQYPPKEIWTRTWKRFELVKFLPLIVFCYLWVRKFFIFFIWRQFWALLMLHSTQNSRNVNRTKAKNRWYLEMQIVHIGLVAACLEQALLRISPSTDSANHYRRDYEMKPSERP